MAATDNKRPLPSKVAAMKACKRRKLEDKPVQLKRDIVRKTELKADSLEWKDVSMPDHLDDYEGFFGLEEVEDVEVIKDPSTGRVSFSARSMDAPMSTTEAETETVDVGSDHHEDADEGEWSGFDEDESNGGKLSKTDPTITASQPRPVERSTNSKPNEPRPVGHSINSKPNGKKANLSRDEKHSNECNKIFNGLQQDVEDDETDISAWRSLNLSPDTLASLSKLRFSKPTPIQLSAIPEILAGHDVIGKASTGSGKTLAFGIPIFEAFLERQSTERRDTQENKSPLALILSPTRELAHQLDKHLTALCSNGVFEGPSIATLTGGLSVQKQQRLLKAADIVIGTPGRLWKVISEGRGIIKSLKGISFLVVDEADRLLSEGHFKEVEEILNALDREEEDDDDDPVGVEDPTSTDATSQKQKAKTKPTPRSATNTSLRQTLVFSATFDRNLHRKLASNKTHPKSLSLAETQKDTLTYLLTKLNFRSPSPKCLDVNPITPLAGNLKEGLIECSGLEKDLYLYTLLLLHPGTRTLVFANSISAVRRLTPFLQNLNLPALALHSGMPQKARLRSVERFTKDISASNSNGATPCSILVATDVAARGLDIPNVQLVIHYHLPRAADTYVHRSGRTARAGQQGSSILICAPEEVAGVRRLVAKVHSTSHADEKGTGGGRQGGYYIRTLSLDRRIVTRLKSRATLAKKIADTTLAKEKRHKEDEFMRSAAEELGVEYDSSDDAAAAKGRRGRGAGRKKKEKEAAGLSKGEVGAMKAELKDLLRQRVNVGVSEKYLTSGGVDMDQLLKQQKDSNGREFLGSVQGVGLLDD